MEGWDYCYVKPNNCCDNLVGNSQGSGESLRAGWMRYKSKSKFYAKSGGNWWYMLERPGSQNDSASYRVSIFRFLLLVFDFGRIIEKIEQGTFMEEPLISVIIPYYKSEKYIDQCLGSILSQTEKRIEVLIMAEAKDPEGIKYLQDKGLPERCRIIPAYGLSGARNKGLNEAKGKYIFFVDSDDFLIREDAFERMAKDLEENDADMVVGEYDYFDGAGYRRGGDCLLIMDESSQGQMRLDNICSPKITYGWSFGTSFGNVIS